MDRRIERTKRNIRRAVIALLRKKAVSAITISELAELADIDRRTFYIHYGTVMDIIREIESETAEDVRKILMGQEKPDIRSILESLNQVMRKNLDFYREISSGSPLSFLKEECKDILKAELTHAYAASSGLEAETFQMCAEYVSSGIISSYTHWLKSPGNTSLEALTDILSRCVEEGWPMITQNGVEAR